MSVPQFSERLGFRAPKVQSQLEGMTSELRSSLWNVIDASDLLNEGAIDHFSKVVWRDFLKEPVDSRPLRYGYMNVGYGDVVDRLRALALKEEWSRVYDFIEFTVHYKQTNERLVSQFNHMLARENSGYRFIDGLLVPITNEAELSEIKEGVSDTRFPGATLHLKRAAELLADRKSPDYRNSIKESICAVESVAKKITGAEKSSLGDALKSLERKYSLHPALKDAFIKLYGYTSDEGGIRHAMLDEDKLTQADARYFLITCSAFINYLKQFD